MHGVIFKRTITFFFFMKLILFFLLCYSLTIFLVPSKLAAKTDFGEMYPNYSCTLGKKNMVSFPKHLSFQQI